MKWALIYLICCSYFPPINMVKHFIGVDGEGLTRKDEQHDYVFLASSMGNCVEDWTYDGLSSRECIDFLCDLHRDNPESYIVGFSFGYDSNMLLRDLHRFHLEELNDKNAVSWVPKKGIKYFIEFIPNKWITFARSHWETGKWVSDGYCKVWDVFGFFQVSFVNALKEWKVAPPDVIARIEEMKLQRGNFEDSQQDEIKSYCFEECELLVKMMDSLEESLQLAGIDIKQYHGPGAIANKLLGTNRAKQYIVREFPDAELNHAVLCGYFGGRIETFAVGFIPERVYRYDINSAYPSAIRYLPNLRNGVWRRADKYERDAPYAIWHCRWQLRRNGRVAPFPYRKETNIYYLREGEGWYHAPEVLAAIETKLPVTVIEGWIFTPNDLTEQPFAWVEEIYNQRQQFKADGNKAEKALKLGLNSLYGKFAQGVSQNGKPGQFQCYYFAGFITSYCRAKALRAAMQDPTGMLAIATDGILSLRPLQLPVSKQLGDWSTEDVLSDGIIIVQPGFIISHSATLVKTRGVSKRLVEKENEDKKRVVNWEKFYDVWQDRGIMGEFDALDKRFCGVGRALNETNTNHGLREKWRRWVSWPSHISFYPSRKATLKGEWLSDTYIELMPFAPFYGHTFSDEYKPKHYGAVTGRKAEAEPVEYLDALTPTD